jgi:hypothetical protein
MNYGAVKADRATALSKTRESKAVGTMLWAIGALSLAAAVNQVAITVCRRGQAAIEPHQYEH